MAPSDCRLLRAYGYTSVVKGDKCRQSNDHASHAYFKSNGVVNPKAVRMAVKRLFAGPRLQSLSVEETHEANKAAGLDVESIVREAARLGTVADLSVLPAANREVPANLIESNGLTIQSPPARQCRCGVYGLCRQ